MSNRCTRWTFSSACAGAIWVVLTSLAVGRGCGSNTEQNNSNLDGLTGERDDSSGTGKADGRDESDDPNAGMDEPGYPDKGDGTTDPNDCNNPPELSECEAIGNICLPFDPMS